MWTGEKSPDFHAKFLPKVLFKNNCCCAVFSSVVGESKKSWTNDTKVNENDNNDDIDNVESNWKQTI